MGLGGINYFALALHFNYLFYVKVFHKCKKLVKHSSFPLNFNVSFLKKLICINFTKI